VVIWCSQAFTPAERWLWSGMPERLKDHGFLVLSRSGKTDCKRNRGGHASMVDLHDSSLQLLLSSLQTTMPPVCLQSGNHDVAHHSRFLVFDDVAKKFNFERLFSVITEGIVLEKKNKDAIKIGVQQSPKIVITTNYTIEGRGGSHDRRKWEVEMSGHFNATHTPLKEFGHQLFDAWGELQWTMFDNFMVNSLMMYLQDGLYQCSWESMHIRKFINETSPEFWEWVDENDAGEGKYKLGQVIYRVEEMAKFIEEYSDWGPKKYNLTSRRWASGRSPA
jgi:hypothetical protein